MVLNLKSREADELARQLAQQTRRTITEAVIYALREQLRREQGRSAAPNLVEDILAIAQRCAALPDHDRRSPKEILGYET